MRSIAEHPEDERPAGGGLARLAVVLASLWILTGAGFKLFLGSPADLPPIVRELPAQVGIELGLTYRLAIAIELAVAFVALLRPRWGWLPLAGVYVAFELVLLTLLGEESCGCFGSSVTLPPEAMAGIDALLLLFLLGTRPWARLPRRGPGPAWIAAAIALGIALPWGLDRELPRRSDADGREGVVVADGEPVEGAWLELDLEDWVGREIFETPLAEVLDFEQVLFYDGLWVFYRSTCDHCAEHLAELAREDTGETFFTLVRLREPHDTEGNRVVFEMPQGGHVQSLELTDAITYVLQTPGELELEGGRVVAGREAVTQD